MSQRTIVEFNHVYTHDIKADGPEFLRLLGLALNGGDAADWEPLQRFGIRRAIRAHHSDDRAAIVNKHEYPFA